MSAEWVSIKLGDGFPGTTNDNGDDGHVVHDRATFTPSVGNSPVELY